MCTGASEIGPSAFCASSKRRATQSVVSLCRRCRDRRPVGAGVTKAIQEVFAVDGDQVYRMFDQLDRVCDEIRDATGREVTRAEFQQLRRRFVAERLAIAARSREGEGSAEDHLLTS